MCSPTHLYYICILLMFIGYDVDRKERVDAVDKLELRQKSLNTPASSVVLRDVPVVCSASRNVHIIHLISSQLIIRLTTVGRRSFPVAASFLWNSLPTDIQSSPSLPVFCQRLKTFLFRQSFSDVVLWLYYASVDFVIVLLFFSHTKNFWLTLTLTSEVNRLNRVH